MTAWVKSHRSRRVARAVSARSENALRARSKDEEALRTEEVNRLKRKVGELTIDLDILLEAAKSRSDALPGTSDE